MLFLDFPPSIVKWKEHGYLIKTYWASNSGFSKNWHYNSREVTQLILSSFYPIVEKADHPLFQSVL